MCVCVCRSICLSRLGEARREGSITYTYMHCSPRLHRLPHQWKPATTTTPLTPTRPHQAPTFPIKAYTTLPKPQSTPCQTDRLGVQPPTANNPARTVPYRDPLTVDCLSEGNTHAPPSSGRRLVRSGPRHIELNWIYCTGRRCQTVPNWRGDSHRLARPVLLPRDRTGEVGLFYLFDYLGCERGTGGIYGAFFFFRGWTDRGLILLDL